jgi:small subunit ribosomal protein S6
LRVPALTKGVNVKQYELTVMFHPDLEMNLTPATDKVKKLIEDNGGTITKESNEGKKRLAYSIAGNNFAVYYYYELELPPQAPARINSVLGITDEVIRSLLVRVDERKLKFEAKRKARGQVKADEAKEETKEEEEE